MTKKKLLKCKLKQPHHDISIIVIGLFFISIFITCAPKDCTSTSNLKNGFTLNDSYFSASEGLWVSDLDTTPWGEVNRVFHLFFSDVRTSVNGWEKIWFIDNRTLDIDCENCEAFYYLTIYKDKSVVDLPTGKINSDEFNIRFTHSNSIEPFELVWTSEDDLPTHLYISEGKGKCKDYYQIEFNGTEFHDKGIYIEGRYEGELRHIKL